MPDNDRGVYVLVIDLKKKSHIEVGKFGMTTFIPGRYFYVGRAKQYLNGRLKRHVRKDKKNFWHIDYLLQESNIVDIWCKRSFFDECQTASTIRSLCTEASYAVRGFGSSDCRCPSHLIHFSGQERALFRLRLDIDFEKAGIHENYG